ncbi:MAG: nuclease-related domain-containing protein, partial [Bacteroidota bacterium]
MWKDLQQGYLSIARSQRLLELEWTRAIKVAERRIHQRRLQAWSAKVASELRRQRTLKILTPLAFVVMCSCAFFSSLLPFALLSWGGAIFVSVIMLVVLVGQTAVVERLEKNPPPKTAGGRKLLNITEKWWDGLKPAPIQIKVDGDTGEKLLVDSLEKQLSSQYIALNKFMVLHNLDADVLILGPSGMWLLESKYHSGKVICRNGEWFHEKRYYGKGGIPKKETLPWKPYDEQWLREREAITRTIQRRLPQDLHWLADEMRGGLVFTHKHITLEIDPSCRVEYGDIPYWVKQINNSPSLPSLTTEVLLCAVDTLLEYANEISAEH